MQGTHFPPRIPSKTIPEDGPFEELRAKSEIYEEGTLTVKQDISLPVMNRHSGLSDAEANVYLALYKDLFEGLSPKPITNNELLMSFEKLNDDKNLEHQSRALILQTMFEKNLKI